MNLPDQFQFSQSSLQDFLDCRKRFYLRYIQKVAWPAVKTEPVLEFEENQKRGQHFHHMIHQSQIGISAQVLETGIEDSELAKWWQNYLDSDFIHLKGMKYPEFYLSARIGEQKIGAKYDLINVTEDGQIIIFDWKSSQKKPSRKWLASRMQTRVYPYVMTKAGRHINPGEDIQAQQIKMIYWFSNFPNQIEVFEYNADQYQDDMDYFHSLLSLILSLQESDFEKTSDDRQCGFCTYRSLCDRGIRAQNAEQMPEIIEDDNEEEIHIDFDQIAEIEF